MPFSVAQP